MVLAQVGIVVFVLFFVQVSKGVSSNLAVWY